MKCISKRILILSFAALLLSLSTGCKKKTPKTVNIETPVTIEIKDTSQDFSSDTQLWHKENKKIYVLFGYNYNEDDFTIRAINLLSKNFGLYENGGIIEPIVFPKSFRHGEKAVNSDLFNILNDDVEICGFVSLGAPENTHRALARIQDQWDGQIPYPVISLFPQDDTLGIEDTSTLVINRLQKADTEEGLVTESVEDNFSDTDEILLKTISYILMLDGSVEKDAALFTHIKQMLNGNKIHRYADSETGLFSINHFVIE